MLESGKPKIGQPFIPIQRKLIVDTFCLKCLAIENMVKVTTFRALTRGIIGDNFNLSKNLQWSRIASGSYFVRDIILGGFE
jgi:hypothetical protein